MTRSIVAVGVFGVLLAAGAAHAQAPQPEPAPAPPPTASADSPEVEARYSQAMTDFAAGHFAEAAAGFDDVAAKTNDPGRKATAAEMGKQARARITTVPASGIGAPPGAGPGGTALGPPAGTLVDNPEDARLDQKSRDGRYVLLIGTTVMGLALYGPTLAILAEDSSSKTEVGMYMLGAGTSFFVPYLLTRDEPVSWGMSDAWLYGSTRGALHGAFLLFVAGDNSNPSDKEVFSTLSLASLAEGTGFTLWANQTRASAGLTNAMGGGSDFGIGFSLGLSSLVLPDDSLGLRWAGIAGLAGAAVGYGAGYWYGTLRNPTWGDGTVLRTAGTLGAYASAVPLILGEVENRQAIAATLMVGAAGGLVLGDRLLEGHDFTTGQGVVTELATIAGALSGAGLAYLATPDSTSSTNEEKALATGAVLGAVGGFALTYLGLDTAAKPAPQTAPSMTLHIGPSLTHDQKGLVAAGTF
jgi:hypothetical protein